MGLLEADELIFDHGRMQGHRSLLRAEWACASAAIRLPPACWLACLLPAVSTASSKLFGAVRPEWGMAGRRRQPAPKQLPAGGMPFGFRPALPRSHHEPHKSHNRVPPGPTRTGAAGFCWEVQKKSFFFFLSGSPEAAAPRLPRNRGRPGRKACPTPVLTAHRRLLRPSQSSRDWGLAHWQHRP